MDLIMVALLPLCVMRGYEPRLRALTWQGWQCLGDCSSWGLAVGGMELAADGTDGKEATFPWIEVWSWTRLWA